MLFSSLVLNLHLKVFTKLHDSVSRIHNFPASEGAQPPQTGAVPWGGGAKNPNSFKKGKKEVIGIFMIKVIKISFSVIFNEEIHALEGLLSQF